MYVIDTEGIGLGAKATKLHCLCYTDNGVDVQVLTDYDMMRKFLSGPGPFVCHNGIRHDNEVFKAVLGIDVSTKMYDTLALSWYVNHDRVKHGLGEYGQEYGIPKPEVEDWENLPLEVYVDRCSEDVKINHKLWVELSSKLMRIYRDLPKAQKLLRYLSFKMSCAAEQETAGWRVDVAKVERHLKELEALQGPAIEALKEVMPMVPVIKKQAPPKVIYKKDNTPSVVGQKWLDLLDERCLPRTHNDVVEVVTGFNEPNPNSPDQVKDWLFSLGWEPCTYKINANKNKVPQIRVSGELTQSVLDLAEQEPAVEKLAGLSVIQHRMGVFKGFLERQEDGWLKAEIEGLTNTLRFKHKKPLVNLPGVERPWGREIRGCLIAPDDDHVLCGSDMVSLESTTKRHFMFPHDPEYVKEMSQPGFDEHLDLAVKAGYLAKEEYNYYKNCDDESDAEWKRIHKIRKKFKPVNYASVYGVQAPRLSRDTKIPLDEAERLISAYWERNWAVEKAVSTLLVRTVDKEMWLHNPVSDLFYSLRSPKDKFSTLNQGTGVFCFDTWLAYCKAEAVRFCGQFHDEYIGPVHKAQVQTNTGKLREAIRRTNERLKLNVMLDIDIKYGENYAEIH